MNAAPNLLTKAIKPADQVQAAYKIQQVYIDQVPEVALYYRNGARGVAARLHNFLLPGVPLGSGSDMWNIQDCWVAG